MKNYTNREKLNAFQKRYDPITTAYRDLTLTEKTLQKWKEEQLKIVIAHVKENSPFYRDHLRDIEPSKLTLDILHKLPFTTKNHLREQMQQILSGSLNDGLCFSGHELPFAHALTPLMHVYRRNVTTCDFLEQYYRLQPLGSLNYDGYNGIFVPSSIGRVLDQQVQKLFFSRKCHS